jgi:CubicO group peptidase (beta-lactamase class C family)
MHALLLTLAFFGLVAASDDTPAQKADVANDATLSELLEPIRVRHDLPALGAAIVTSKGLRAVGVVGVRKRGSDVKATVNDQFHIGSDTKALTAALVARLIEAGKLDWDTTLDKAFPELKNDVPDEFRDITVTHLLTHHSGLPAHIAGGWWSVAPGEPVRKQRLEAVKRAFKEKLAAKPGDKFIYSSVGYVILAAMAEHAADASWEELMERRLFKPLDMKSAGFGPMGKVNELDQPRQHDAKGKPFEPVALADNPPVMGPAGRIHCSLPDWAKFVADQLNGTRGGHALLRSETYKKMHKAPFNDEHYTLGGWISVPSPQGRLLVHDGSNTLNYASALLAPQDDIAILIVTNQGGPGGPGQKGCQEARKALMKHVKLK